MMDHGDTRTEPAPEGEPLLSAPVRGLIWREWLIWEPTFYGFLTGYIILGWLVMLFFHPAWIIGFGAILGLSTGTSMGGRDVAEGVEEFSFALPPTRGEQFLARFAFGGSVVAAFAIVGTISVAFDLPQLVWGLFVSSGLTEPFMTAEPRFLYALAIIVPIAAYSYTFAVAAISRTRSTAANAWILSAVICGILVGAGLMLEYAIWKELNGIVSSTLLVVAAVLGALRAYTRYVIKECGVGPHGGTPRLAGALLAIGLGLLVFMFLVFARNSAVAPPPPVVQVPAPTAEEGIEH